MKIKATLLLILLSAILLNVPGKSCVYFFSAGNSKSDALVSSCKSENPRQIAAYKKQAANGIQDYYQTDEDDDSYNISGFQKPQNASSFSAVFFHSYNSNPTTTSSLGKYTPKRYLLYRVFII